MKLLQEGINNIGIIALIVSLVALLISFLRYNLKLNIKIFCNYSIASSSECEDRYVSNIVLENQKDRAISIFGIYLHIKPNYYIQLADYKNKPLILEPFSTYTESFGPIQYYCMNTSKLNMNKIFELRNFYKISYIVLSTSIGKYTVKKAIKRWEPIGDFFKNHLTAWVKPYTLKIHDRYIGSNIKYVVIFKINEKEQVILLEENDYMLAKFWNIQFTKESLENKEALKEFISGVISDKKIKCDSFEILTPDSWKSRYELKTVDAHKLNWFQYFILGKIATILSDRRIDKQNKKQNKRKRKSNHD
jgi:hypothetical protein